MRSKVLPVLLVTMALAGCAGGNKALRSDVSQAADPRARVSSRIAGTFQLGPDEFDQAVATSRSVAAEDSMAAATQPPAEVKTSIHEHAGEKTSKSSTSRAPGWTAQPRPQPTKQVVFACPMHPDVTDTTASTCPKCGMTLEPQERP